VRGITSRAEHLGVLADVERDLWRHGGAAVRRRRVAAVRAAVEAGCAVAVVADVPGREPARRRPLPRADRSGPLTVGHGRPSAGEDGGAVDHQAHQPHAARAGSTWSTQDDGERCSRRAPCREMAGTPSRRISPRVPSGTSLRVKPSSAIRPTDT
jgi:hypothetical protein